MSSRSNSLGTASAQSLRIASIYAGVAALWIAGSDTVLEILFADARQLSVLQTIKGWLFVAVTSALLYWLVRRRIQAALDSATVARESEQRFHAAFEHAAVGIGYVALDGTFLRVNRRLCEIAGYTGDELVGRRFQDITHPADLAADLDFRRRILAGETSACAREKRYVRPDGVVVWVNLTAAPERDDQGALKYFITIVEDITARKHAENALQESEQRLRMILEAEPECVKVIDAEGRVLQMNAAGLAMIEVEHGPEQAIGKHVGALIAPEHRPAFREFSQRVLRGERGILEFEIVGLKGTHRWVECHAVPLRDAASDTVSILCVTRDITENKRAEHAARGFALALEHKVRERTAELEAVNRELESFSYSVSHDLRAPLRAIDGFSKLLSEDLAGKLDPQAQTYLGRIRANVQHMGELIDHLLDLSRLSRHQIHCRSVDLSCLADEVIAELRIRNPSRHVDVAIQPGLSADADPMLMRVVLENLLGNAWKFTAQRQDARIELGPAGDVDGKQVFFVRDNGAGFDMNYAGKLFGVFQRLHRASEFQGNGIGLASAQRILRRHGGDIRGEGEVGKGATFYFSLPGGGTKAVTGTAAAPQNPM